MTTSTAASAEFSLEETGKAGAQGRGGELGSATVSKARMSAGEKSAIPFMKSINALPMILIYFATSAAYSSSDTLNLQ